MKKLKGQLKDHLEKIFAFVTIVNTGSITNAAFKLHISQAALSRSIIILENALQTKLFIRNRTGIQLTDSGKILFEFSKKLLFDIDSVESNLELSSKNDIIKLRVGTHEGLAINFWPNFLEEFSIAQPNILVSLLSGRIENLLQSLLNKEYHLIVTVEPLFHNHLKIVPIFENTFRFYKGPKSKTENHSLLKKNHLSKGELNELPLFTDVNSQLSQQLSLIRYLTLNGIDLANLFELNSFEASLRLANKGLGVALLPELIGEEAIMRKQLQALSVEGVSNKSFGRHKICVSILKSEENSSSISKLIKALTQLKVSE